MLHSIVIERIINLHNIMWLRKSISNLKTVNDAKNKAEKYINVRNVSTFSILNDIFLVIAKKKSVIKNK